MSDALTKGAKALLTLKRAAEIVGIKGRWREHRLKRMLEAKERTLGQPILIRFGGKGSGVRYRVTLAALREHCPEMFSRRDEIAEVLREQFDALEDRIAELHERDRLMAQEIAALKRQVGELTRANGS